MPTGWHASASLRVTDAVRPRRECFFCLRVQCSRTLYSRGSYIAILNINISLIVFWRVSPRFIQRMKNSTLSLVGFVCIHCIKSGRNGGLLL